MATEYKDILRVEGPEDNLVNTTLRNKQVGFATDDQHRMLRKNAVGTPDYWVPEGYDVTYNNISVGQYLYYKDDLTTYLKYSTGAFELVAGGKTYIATSSGKLVLEEEVKIGEYVLPYTGGISNQVLGIIETGVVGWVEGGYGVTGTQGVTGPSGGEQGVTGLQGLQGETGISYGVGDTGPMGQMGATGAQGLTGIGIPGATGIQGSIDFTDGWGFYMDAGSFWLTKDSVQVVQLA